MMEMFSTIHTFFYSVIDGVSIDILSLFHYFVVIEISKSLFYFIAYTSEF